MDEAESVCFFFSLSFFLPFFSLSFFGFFMYGLKFQFVVQLAMNKQRQGDAPLESTFHLFGFLTSPLSAHNTIQRKELVIRYVK